MHCQHHDYDDPFDNFSGNLLMRIQDMRPNPITVREHKELLEDYMVYRAYLNSGTKGMTEGEKKIMDLIHSLIIELNSNIRS